MTKINIPSVRRLRDALSKAKKENNDSAIMHFRVLVLKSKSWVLETGLLPLGLVEPFDDLVAQHAGFTLRKGANAHHTAKAVVDRLRAQLEPVTPPVAVPEEVQGPEEEDYPADHPLLVEARESHELKEVDWEPPVITPREELDEDASHVGA